MVLPLSLLVSLSAGAARGVLKADGIIRVKGAELASATITVVPGNASAYILQVVSKNITLELPLDDVYLISVQLEGCPTKEIYFDTRVPAEMHASEFGFPFQVTLESLTPERMFTYAGPVGFVRYVHGSRDFGYETQYVVRVEEDLKQRMQEIRETGVDAKIMVPIALARVLDRSRGEYSAPLGTAFDADMGTTAPMVSEVPRLVHVVSASEATEETKMVREAALPVLSPAITVVPSAPLPSQSPISVVVASKAVAPATISRKAAPIVKTRILVSTSELRSAPTLAPKAPGVFSRSEEIIEEPRRVTMIIRLTEPTGNMEEYRMVTHAFGAVFYFQDNRSITKRDFSQAIAK